MIESTEKMSWTKNVKVFKTEKKKTTEDGKKQEKEKEKLGKKISLWSKRKQANQVCQGKTKKEENIFQTQTSIQERKKL